MTNLKGFDIEPRNWRYDSAIRKQERGTPAPAGDRNDSLEHFRDLTIKHAHEVSVMAL